MCAIPIETRCLANKSQAYSAGVLQLWNSLPPDLRTATSLEVFQYGFMVFSF